MSWTDYVDGPEDDPKARFEHKDAPQGCFIQVRQPCELLLDIDSKRLPGSVLERINKIPELGYKVESIIKSRSRNGNLHVVVTLNKEVTDLGAIALQLFIGSDPIREFMSLGRHSYGVENPTILFRPLVGESL